MDITKIVLHNRIKECEELIESVKGRILDADMKRKFAYEILSKSPFSTTLHLCSAFSCTKDELEEMMNEDEQLKREVERGLIDGEIYARKLMLYNSFENSALINTTLLKLLSGNVYGIKETQDISVTPSKSVDFKIEVVDKE